MRENYKGKKVNGKTKERKKKVRNRTRIIPPASYRRHIDVHEFISTIEFNVSTTLPHQWPFVDILFWFHLDFNFFFHFVEWHLRFSRFYFLVSKHRSERVFHYFFLQLISFGRTSECLPTREMLMRFFIFMFVSKPKHVHQSTRSSQLSVWRHCISQRVDKLQIMWMFLKFLVEK